MPPPSTFAPPELECAHDALTNTLTRPCFVAVVRERRQHAARRGDPFAVFLVDVDQLQNVNDRHGQRAGDGVLAALAKRLHAVLAGPAWSESGYALGRYDGDALIVLAHPCTMSQAERLAESLREGVAQAPLDEYGMTVSVGGAQHRIGESTDELLARAERALHLAKQSGRDSVEISRAAQSHARRAPVVALRG